MSKHAKYLLDTNIVSYAVNADWNKPESYPHWISRHLRVHQKHCCLPSIAVEEISYGIHRNGVGHRRKAKMDRWLNRLPNLAYDIDAAQIAGQLRADLDSKGLKLDEYDVQIAAIALQHDLTLVTHNTKHFQRIPNLRIENWADKPITAEMFFRAFIWNTMRTVYTWAAILIAFLAYLFAVQPNINQLSQWLPPFFLNVVVFSIIVGTALGLAARAIIKICLILRQRRFI